VFLVRFVVSSSAVSRFVFRSVPRALADFSLTELEQLFVSWGVKPLHAGRVLRAFYRAEGGPATPLTTSTPGAPPASALAAVDAGPARARLPSQLIERLQAELAAAAATLATRQVSADGTAKLLLRLNDGRTVESVLMPDFRTDRAAGCVSSQVGCAMRCDFCATTKTGFERNLTAGEMVEQFLALRREANAAGRVLQTLVFMGMGEPMLNLDAVLEAVRRMADNRMGGLGWRQITVSTVGIVAGIDALKASGLNVNLAVSLHAPDDATRVKLLPTAKGHSIADILAAADRYQASRNDRPVIIQYCLLKDVNDSPEQARQLATVLDGRRMHVNLLNYNPTGLSLQGRAYEPSGEERSQAFVAELRQHGVIAHFRRSRGPDIDAACGQLRRRLAEQA
jgi:23S rRNA (adenine2503-C2)-methyltransferase